MLALRVWSGLSYRRLERRAQARGDALPRSTLAAAFTRASLPGADTVAAFVRACGLDDDATTHWLRIRRQIAAGGQEVEAEVQHRLARWLRRGWVLAVFGVAAALALGISLAYGVVIGRSPNPSTSAPAKLPRPGVYRIQVMRSGSCLSEQAGSGSGHLYETACQEQFPAMALERVSGDIYRVTTDHPEFGPGCMGIPFAGVEEGTEVEDGECGKGAVEQYRWEPVVTPAVGYRIHPTHSDMCLGYPAGSEIGHETLRQLPCDSSLGQVFGLL